MYYLKQAFVNPKKIHRGRAMKKRQVALVIAVITLFITAISILRVVPIISSIQTDGQELAEKIPDFEIVDGMLSAPDEESYIHQTDSFLLFFAPDNQFTTEEIDKNLTRLTVPVGIGLLQNDFYISFQGYGVETPYDQLGTFTGESLRTLLNSFGSFSILTYVFTFIFTYLGIGLITLFELIFILLFANLLSKILRSQLRFKENLRIAVLASILPTIAIEFATFFGILSAYTFELKIGLSLYLFYLAIKDMKKMAPTVKEK
ncbi:DUF1189 domain-containing protein [Marinilactibacillus kalidii]|uniref:DUF1189 domain-containing protein n=1 Tax=Marinilactibacillus kalidii TaxID=2820274 RepID=UPI001ABE5243|nr:DUF1189 domain-containing protein [Marinilactibacillus kalidii]